MPLLNLPENQRIRTGMIPEENLSTIQNVATRTAAVTETNLLTQPDVPSRPLVLKVVNRTDYSNQQFEINDSNCIIGSGERANIQVQHPALTAYHCEFVRNPAGIYVRQIGAEILVNGQALPEAWVYPGDKIQMGNFDVEVVDVGQFIMSHSPVVLENQAPEPQQEAAVEQQQQEESADPGPQAYDDAPAVEIHPPIEEPADDLSASFASPVVEAPDEEATFKEAPTAEMPAVSEIPEWETPADEAPAVETPAFENPVQESPFAETHETNLPDEAVPPQPFVDNGDDIINATLGQVQEELATGGVETPPGMPGNETGEMHSLQDDQARWLDELYESAVDEEVETTPPLNPESHGWTDDSVAPHLMQPNVDPSEFNDLPNPTAQESNRVLDQIEGVLNDGSADPVQEPDHNESIPAVSEGPDENESSWKQEWHRQEQPTEGTSTAPTAFSSLLEQLEQENPADEAGTPSPGAEAAAEPFVEAASVTEPEVENESQDEVKIESVADVLARLRAAGSLDYDVPANENEAATASQTPVEGFVAAEANANALENPGEEESVQDYMNQLMHRLRKDGGNAARPGAESVEPDNESSEEEKTAPQPVQDENEEEDLSPENPMLPGEFVPNDVAPEQTSTLDALRQVANQSVENAIKRSAREKSNETSLIYLGASSACLFLSAVLFVLSKGVFDVAFILAVVFAIGCVAFGFMFLSIGSAKEKMRARKNNKRLESRMNSSKS